MSNFMQNFGRKQVHMARDTAYTPLQLSKKVKINQGIKRTLESSFTIVVVHY